MLGCHQGALFAPSGCLEGACSYHRLRAFLERCGTRFHGDVGAGDGLGAFG